MSWRLRRLAIVAGICGALAPVWGLVAAFGCEDRSERPVDCIYERPVLAHFQKQYLPVFDEILNEFIKHFTADEQKKLANVRLEFKENLPGSEPVGFFADDRDREKIILSVASLKFFEDLSLSYAWLGRRNCSLNKINDYLGMLRYWSEQGRPDPGRPPGPLKALGIPDNARDDAETKRLAIERAMNADTFILLHELGHIYNGDFPSSTGFPYSQEQEANADEFALDLMRRMGRDPMGIAQYFTWISALMPSRADFPDDAAYQKAVQNQRHPLATKRLTTVANDMDQNASKYAANSKIVASFHELAAEERKLAAQLDDASMQRLIAQRARTLKVEDLVPRRPGGTPATPLGDQGGHTPFQGKLLGVTNYDRVSDKIEVMLQNRSGRVTGALGWKTAIARIDGAISGNQLSFGWRLPDAQGRGLLRFDGSVYTGTVGFGDSATGAAMWTLQPAQGAEPFPKISGTWRDAGAPSNTTDINQLCETFEFRRRGKLPTGVRFESTGSGEFKGQMFVAEYSAKDESNSTSTGECFGRVSPDTRSLTENCLDLNSNSIISISAVRR